MGNIFVEIKIKLYHCVQSLITNKFEDNNNNNIRFKPNPMQQQIQSTFIPEERNSSVSNFDKTKKIIIKSVETAKINFPEDVCRREWDNFDSQRYNSINDLNKNN